MKQVLTAAFVAAGLAAFGVRAGADELRIPASLTSFGAPQTLSSYSSSAAGLVLGPAQTSSGNIFAGGVVELPVIYGGAVQPQSFAASTAININLALDAGYNLDLTQRFDNYDARMSPLFDQAGFLGLANGGRYAGLTYEPAPDLRLRLGVQYKSNRLDGFALNPRWPCKVCLWPMIPVSSTRWSRVCPGISRIGAALISAASSTLNRVSRWAQAFIPG